MKQMKKIRHILAIKWAFACIFLILAVFMGAPKIFETMRKLSFMKISPLFTGGDSNYVVEKDSLTIKINKPVFEALIGEANEGFVQLTFSGKTELPKLIDQEIDYNNDKIADLKLKINTLENITEFEGYLVKLFFY